MRAAEALTGHPINEGCEVELLINGDQIFPAMLETIRGAEETLCLETYVYWRGDIASEIAEAVCERAAAGVECRVLVDAVGAAKITDGLIDQMQDAGVKVVRFRPPRLYSLRHLANRTHRRLLVADGRVGMTGGVGIAGEWEGDARGPDEWRDTHVRIRGPVVRGMQGAFAEHWLEATGEVLGGERFLPELEPIDGRRPGPADPLQRRRRRHQRRGDLLPGDRLGPPHARHLRRLLRPSPRLHQSARRSGRTGSRGARRRPRPHIDKEFVRQAGRAAYEPLLEAGVRIFEYQPTMLHAKSMAVDGCWATVGTINFDNRSFQLNDEITLARPRASASARRWSRDFDADVARSEEIDADRWRHRGPGEPGCGAGDRRGAAGGLTQPRGLPASPRAGRSSSAARRCSRPRDHRLPHRPPRRPRPRRRPGGATTMSTASTRRALTYVTDLGETWTVAIVAAAGRPRRPPPPPEPLDPALPPAR